MMFCLLENKKKLHSASQPHRGLPPWQSSGAYVPRTLKDL